MSLIIKRGRVPKTPHTEFYSKPGVLALEEIHGCYGFSGAYSRKMHTRSYPTVITKPPRAADFNLKPQAAPDLPLQPFHIKTGRIPYGADALRARRCMLFGPQTAIFISKPARSSPGNEFFRNGDAHELFFVQEGSGILASEYGDLAFKPKQYLVLPKGTTYQVRLESAKAFFLIIESIYPIHFPPHYLNAHGQATMMSPVVESEIGLPDWREPIDKKGDCFVMTKHGGGRLSRLTLGHHPFDLCGWEGALYPFSFDSADHHSLSREIHTAPPTRQTFQAGMAPHGGWAICTFRGQMEGWHPLDTPAPYAHFNVDSDEVMFFSNTSYGARKGAVEPGSFTFHPGALPHSPHGSAAKRSFAERGKLSDYLAIMLDTFFEPLKVAKQALPIAEKAYPESWNKEAL